MNKTKQSTIDTIQKAIDALKAKGIKPTHKNISIETGLSTRTIVRNIKMTDDNNKMTVIKDKMTPLPTKSINKMTEIKPKDNKVTDSFERFKRRATIKEVFKCTTIMF